MDDYGDVNHMGKKTQKAFDADLIGSVWDILMGNYDLASGK